MNLFLKNSIRAIHKELFLRKFFGSFSFKPQINNLSQSSFQQVNRGLNSDLESHAQTNLFVHSWCLWPCFSGRLWDECLAFMEVLFLGNALLAQELPLSYPLRDSFQSCSSKKPKAVSSKYTEPRKEHDLKAEQWQEFLLRVQVRECHSSDTSQLSHPAGCEHLALPLPVHSILGGSTYGIFQFAVWWQGDRKPHWFYSWCFKTGKASSGFIGEYVHRFMLGTLGTDHATFASNLVISPFFFIFERRLQYSAMAWMAVLWDTYSRWDHSTKHNTTKRLIRNKINLVFSFA